MPHPPPSDARVTHRRRALAPHRRLLALATSTALVACVTTSTRFFLPSPQNPTYRPLAAEAVLTDYVRLQCEPRREAQRPDTGSAAFAVELDSTGRALRAQMLRSSRDTLLDGVFGTVAAQLRLDRDSAAVGGRGATEPVRIDFRCAGDSTRVHLTVGSR